MATRNTTTKRTSNRKSAAKPAPRRRRAMAEENPTPSKTVGNGKGNGNGNGEAKVTPASEIKELTPAQKEELRAARSRKKSEATTLTLNELLTKRVMGVGKTIADKALADAKLKGNAKSTTEQVERANRASKDKAGLRGKALAMWVLTGDSNGGDAKPSTSTPTTTRARSASTSTAKSALDGKVGQDLLVKYLKAETSNADNALAKALPTFDGEKLRVKARHFEAWLAKETKTTVTRPQTTAVLKEAGLKSEQWSALPAGKRVVYAGSIPAGVGKLPVRKVEA